MQKGANNTYWGNVKEGIASSLKGLSLSFRHLLQARRSRKPMFVGNESYFDQKTGIVTTQYPKELLPVPDNGRYQLHNEMDDCIVCDKCAKVCPVDCIEIEPIKATGVVGHASDGSAIRLYAAKFDIDMAKCCFCGLCTTVCPTECLTMAKDYDFTEFDVTKLNFAFGNLSSEEAQEKKDLYEQYMLEKEAFKKQTAKSVPSADENPKPVAKPAFRPTARPAVAKVVDETPAEEPKVELPSSEETPKAKPAFRPAFKKPVVKEEGSDAETVVPTTEAVSPVSEEAKPKPAFRPKFKKPSTDTNPEVIEEPKSDEPVAETPAEIPAVEEAKPKPAFRPKFKKSSTDANPEVIEEPKSDEPVAEAPAEIPAVEEAKPKPAFRPKFKKPSTDVNPEVIEEPKSDEPVAETPAEIPAVEEAKPKPAFR
nr:4Fe-4S binding protein [Flectobacillus sp.]